jgi:hypothetical protein
MDKHGSSNIGKRKGRPAENGIRKNVPDTTGIRKGATGGSGPKQDVRSQAESHDTIASAPSDRAEGQSSNPSQNSGRKSLWPFYNQVNAYEYANPRQASRLFDDILAEGLDNYTAPPDTWHNAAMVAGRVDHNVAQLKVVEAGLREWPDNVDLLCDEMQYRQSTHYDPERLAEIWDKLSSMDRSRTAPYWRFWATGATYYALELDQPTEALRLLDEGLRSVRRDALQNILGTYRRVLVDSVPTDLAQDEEEVAAHQKAALDTLEERYKLGIQLGVENGYVLATDLARLYQEQAASVQPDAEQQTAATSGAHAGSGDDYLRKALHYLDLAEQLYTGSPNHPIWQIYEQRVRILMAQRRYGDAFKFLRCLPASRLREPSLATMLSLASLMTGERIEEEVSLSPEGVVKNLDTILPVLLANEGELLFTIADEDSSVHVALLRVTQRLQNN